MGHSDIFQQPSGIDCYIFSLHLEWSIFIFLFGFRMGFFILKFYFLLFLYNGTLSA